MYECVQVESCLEAPEILEGLAMRWNGYNMLSGKVEKIAPSSCGVRTCPLAVDVGRVCQMDSVDKRGPIAQFCPGDLYVESDQKEVNVSWPIPRFSDENPIEHIDHNLSPGLSQKDTSYIVFIFAIRSTIVGQVFSYGSHLVVYAAYDNSSNVGQCSFKLHVEKQFCPTLQQPSHGAQVCDSWGPGLRYSDTWKQRELVTRVMMMMLFQLQSMRSSLRQWLSVFDANSKVLHVRQ